MNRMHFFIPITLSFPKRSCIKTYAFVDSGATGSHISHSFVHRHSLPLSVKPQPIPIFTIDERPLSSGLMTHDVKTSLRMRNHSELISLGVVTMPYPVLLGLNWLKAHNPDVDWTRGKLALSCCGSNHKFPVSAFGKGYDLVSSKHSSHFSVGSVGLGFGLSSNPPLSPYSLPDISPSTPSVHYPPGIFANIASISSVLRPPTRNGLGREELKSIWLTSPIPPEPIYGPQNKPIKVDHVIHSRFIKSAKDLDCYCIWYTPSDQIEVRINSITPHPPPAPTAIPSAVPVDDVPDPDEEIRKIVPPKYHSYLDVFSPVEVNRLPDHRPYDINIDIEEGKTPPFGPIYSLTMEERKALSDYIEEHLAKGFIQRSTSSASSPILFIKRKTGDLRLCVDYRGLNAITKKNRYPLPLTHDLIDRVAGCSKFTVIDLKNAFNLIRVKEGDEWKTAFRTHLGLYKYTVMPFGLTNAPATFQAFIQDTLRDLLDVICVVYLDDILIYSKPGQDHDAMVQQVLERLRSANLFANAKKCEFDKSQVEYLGFIISSQGVQMNPKKFSTIVDWPVPNTVKKIQSFLGFTNFYRRFIHHYADLVLPLNSLTTNTAKLSFKGLTDAAKDAFEKLKTAFTTAPVLCHFDPLLPTTVVTDASDFALASILLQPDNSQLLHPVAYHSRKFSPAEINYEIHNKELLAIVDTFRDFRSWLVGSPHPIAVISDHKNLEYFMSSQPLNRRQARWAMLLSEYDFQLQYSPGSKNPADAPSRRPDFIPSDTPFLQRPLLTDYNLHKLFPAFASTSLPNPSKISALSTFNIDNSELLDDLKRSYQEDTEWREAILSKDVDFTIQDNLVYHKNRLFVPSSMRPNILALRHDSVLSGHPGRAVTVDLVRRDFSWPGLQTFVCSYVKSCPQCARIKNANHKPYGLLKASSIPRL